MFRLTTLLRSFLAGSVGNAGAVANVRSVLEDRRREDWIVEGLLHRLEPVPTATPAAEPAASTQVA